MESERICRPLYLDDKQLVISSIDCLRDPAYQRSDSFTLSQREIHGLQTLRLGLPTQLISAIQRSEVHLWRDSRCTGRFYLSPRVLLSDSAEQSTSFLDERQHSRAPPMLKRFGESPSTPPLSVALELGVEICCRQPAESNYS